MTEPSPRGVVNVRLYPDVAARVRAWAEREKRTLNNAVNVLLDRALDAEQESGVD